MVEYSFCFLEDRIHIEKCVQSTNIYTLVVPLNEPVNELVVSLRPSSISIGISISVDISVGVSQIVIIVVLLRITLILLILISLCSCDRLQHPISVVMDGIDSVAVYFVIVLQIG